MDRLIRPIDPERDHVLGGPDATMTLTEYGSYTCPHCQATHDVIADLRDRFGDRMRYVFRHRPLASDDSWRAAEIAEIVWERTGEFWPVHDALMRRGPVFAPGALDEIAAAFEAEGSSPSARRRIEEDAESAVASGASMTPTFFVGDQRYEGPWDEASLAEAMLGSLAHRMQVASLEFARWGPSTGLLLLVASIAAVVLTNSTLGPAFEALWNVPVGVTIGGAVHAFPLQHWINHGLLTVFFLVVGLEIKRELTVGRLASRRAAALPVAAAVGGMLVPALIYLAIAPARLASGWAVPIATDTAFAVAVIAMLGDRVPVELRVFLTAAVIVDDLVAIVVVALFYAGALDGIALLGAAATTAGLALLNRAGVYRPLPYAALGLLSWCFLHASGVHATLAGVVLAVSMPTRPPPNFPALLAQADALVREDLAQGPELRHGPSEPTMRQLDAIHERMESPADKLLRTLEPWSSYAVLPVFALANAGLVVSTDVLVGHGRSIAAIVAGLVVGKPLGILGAAALAVRLGLADKPDAYSWRQVAGAGALAGIGFTMSVFIAQLAFAADGDFVAAKLAIFLASFLAGTVGALVLVGAKPPK